MNPITGHILVSAFFILAFSIFNLVTYTSTISSQSTFALEPSYFNSFSTSRDPSDIINGQFQENNSMLVRFYIMSSAQFAANELNASFRYLYALPDVPSGNFYFTIAVRDTYYLLFDHGAGLTNVKETVNFQRSYTTHDKSRLLIGVLSLCLAVADFYYAFRSSRESLPRFPPPSGPWLGD